MGIDQNAHSFGNYLKSIRIEKGISLEAVSRETRIRLVTLVYIESEDHSNLPAEVFVKGFLRAFAAVIGADGDDAVRRYGISLGAFKKGARSESPLFRRLRAAFWPWIVVCLGIMGGGIAISALVMSGLNNGLPPKEQLTVQEVGKDPHEIPERVPQRVRPARADTANESERLRLRVTATQETWLKIIRDDQAPETYHLNCGDRIELDASDGFNILVGSAGNAKLTLNGQPVNVPGKSGQMVNIQIP